MVKPYRLTKSKATKESIIDYGLSMTGVPEAWNTTKGGGIKVAVIDTGWSDHKALKYAHKVGDQDSIGHGTHVAGIIKANGVNEGAIGIAPECILAGIKGIPGDWSGMTEALRAALDWEPDIVNMSLGSRDEPPKEFIDLVGKAYEFGVILVASAGNVRQKGVDTICYPARLDTVIPVAAIGPNRSDAPFSATGSELERGYCMPGVKITSTWLGQGWAKCTGTSMAAPSLAGVIALLLAKHLVKQGSTPIPEKGKPRLNEVIQHLDYASNKVGDPLLFGKGYIDAGLLR